MLEQFETVKSLPNVLLKAWIPQPTVLAHPKTKVFITHGGSHSFIEAVEARVPVITMPLVGLD